MEGGESKRQKAKSKRQKYEGLDVKENKKEREFRTFAFCLLPFTFCLSSLFFLIAVSRSQ
jgi:hypothetical protein